MDASRLRRKTRNGSHLAEAGHLRDVITVQHAAEIMWPTPHPRSTRVLVPTRGWPLERYSDFSTGALIAALLPAASPGRPIPNLREPSPKTRLNRATQPELDDLCIVAWTPTRTCPRKHWFGAPPIRQC